MSDSTTTLPATAPEVLEDLSPAELDSASIAALIDKDPSDLTREERLRIIAKLRRIRGEWLAAAQEARTSGKRTKVPKSAQAPKAPKLSKDEISKLTLEDLGL
jgi:hypothetical protein